MQIKLPRFSPAILGLFLSVFPVSALAQFGPQNDDFFGRSQIFGQQAFQNGSNSQATTEFNEPNHGQFGGPLASVWYEWNPAASGQATVSLGFGLVDHVVAVYTGSNLFSLQSIATGNNFSDATFTASSTQRYFIAVDSEAPFFGQPQTGNFSLSVSIAAAPGNDDRLDADSILNPSGIRTGTTVLATLEANEPTHDDVGQGNSVWYRFSPTQSGRYEFEVDAFGFSPVLVAYQEPSAFNFPEVAASSGTFGEALIQFEAEAFTNYYLVVDTSTNSTGDFTLRGREVSTGDDFASAIPLSGTSVVFESASNVGATSETGEPLHASGAAGASVWFTWPAPEAGVYRFRTTEADFTTALSLYTGNTVAGLTLVEGSVADSPTSDNSITILADAGDVVKIAVDGLAALAPSAGQFSLSVTKESTAYETWIDAFSSLPANQRAEGDDPDRDGLPNVIEMLLGLNPEIPVLSPSETAAENAPEFFVAGGVGSLALEFGIDESLQDGIAVPQLRGQFSADLETWQDVPVITTEGNTRRLEPPSEYTGQKGFFQLIADPVELPEA